VALTGERDGAFLTKEEFIPVYRCGVTCLLVAVVLAMVVLGTTRLGKGRRGLQPQTVDGRLVRRFTEQRSGSFNLGRMVLIFKVSLVNILHWLNGYNI
jgi:hypothetical protein